MSKKLSQVSQGNLQQTTNAIFSLRGIIDGIEADKILKIAELKALKSWIEQNKSFGKHPPFSTICEFVEIAVADNKLTKSEVDGITFLIEKSIPSLFKLKPLVYLQGLLKGFAADGILNDLEIKNLRKWLLDNENLLAGLWPFDELFTLSFSFKNVSDISPDYINYLKCFINDYIAIGGSSNLQFPIDPNFQKPVSAVCATDPSIEFSGKKFCITGKSFKYSRSEIFDLIAKAGGIPTESASCDYLVICAEGSTQWAFSTYGNKIASAIEMRKKGLSIFIISEKDLFDAIQSSESAS